MTVDLLVTAKKEEKPRFPLLKVIILVICFLFAQRKNVISKLLISDPVKHETRVDIMQSISSFKKCSYCTMEYIYEAAHIATIHSRQEEHCEQN